jgi:DNA invertase Pin-like site-specific DNA recombinase
VRRTAETAGSKRCAIYTRKSTSQGLEQEFNSLDAQREACQAYAKAQGWSVTPEAYEDGGFTGANVERPAFQRLLAEVDAKKFDVVVVYKVDRLSRSLLDFAKVMDRFNAAGIAFVSVTQNFSTADAMGRLTLNLLMSFAEFEREMISERTRDKMRAARRKGKWTGGTVPFGYDLAEGKLRVNELESVIVREIFASYVKHRSIVRILDELRERGRTTKRRGSCLAKAWTKDAVLRILRNPLYVGRTLVGGETFDAEHEPIVDRETFARVEGLLGRGASRTTATVRRGYLLRGLLRCAGCGAGLTPASAFKGKREYRYYRCQTREKQGTRACSAGPISAPAVENFVMSELRKVHRDAGLTARLTTAVMARTEQARATLRAEERALPAELARTSGEASRIADAIVTASTAAREHLERRLEEVGARLSRQKARVEQIGRELARLDGLRADAEWVAGIIGDFDRLWKRLTAENRARVVRALVAEVHVDEGRGLLRIVFRDANSTRAAG